MQELQLKVLSNVEIAKNLFEMQFILPVDIQLKSGQFIHIATGSKQHLLRRPIAIADIDDDSFSICYQVKGSGTQSLMTVKAGEELQAVLPLGNYFAVESSYKKVAVLGGGVGLFPLLAFAKEHAKALEIYSYMGFRNIATVCKVQEFERYAKVAKFATDDGSFSEKGNVVDLFVKDMESQQFDAIYACGPLPMLRALKQVYTDKQLKIPCFVSLEERMGCGIGACLVCVCQSANKDKNFRVCKDGPIFKIDEVIL